MARVIGTDSSRNAVVVLPPPGNPDRYNWQWVSGIRCRVVPTRGADPDTLHRLAVLLVYAGSPFVEVLNDTWTDSDTYRPRVDSAEAG